MFALFGPTVGTIAGWLTLVVLVGGAWTLRRGGSATAVTELQAVNRVLEDRVKALERQAAEDSKTIAQLRARTDMTSALQPILSALESHEARAAERHHSTQASADRQIGLLGIIGDRLGKEPNGNGGTGEPLAA